MRHANDRGGADASAAIAFEALRKKGGLILPAGRTKQMIAFHRFSHDSQSQECADAANGC